ncbi:Uncharacterised protein [Klebsiella variicola]|nr:Uncharacterised protein [Klebsiella variicola]SXE55361.1 Uncharacterised protein [Klebsiella variicola]
MPWLAFRSWWEIAVNVYMVPAGIEFLFILFILLVFFIIRKIDTIIDTIR